MEGKKECVVRGEIKRGFQLSRIGVSRSRSGSLEIRINGEKIRRSSELALCLPTIVLGPDSINLLIGSPVRRRSFMNWGTFHVEPFLKKFGRERIVALSREISLFSKVRGKIARELDRWFN